MSYFGGYLPHLGDMGTLSTFSTNLTTLKADVDAVRLSVDTARGLMTTSAFGGQGGTAWRTQANDLVTAFDPLSQRMSDVITAITAYVSASDDIIARAQPYLTATDQIDGEFSALYFSSTYRGGSRYSSSTYPPYQLCVDPSDTAAMESYHGDLLARLGVERQAVWDALSVLSDERATAASALCTALSAGQPSNWDAVYSALLRAGVTSADDLTTSDVVDLLSTLSQRIASGEGSPDDVEDLTALLSVYGDDHIVTSRLFIALGGESTVKVINELGLDAAGPELDPALALAAAAAFRSALSVGSSRWHEGTADRFVDGMVENVSSTGGGLVASIGFLFSDTNTSPLGENLTVAMADRIDEWERDPNRFYAGSPVSDNSAHSGGRNLSFLEDPAGGARVNDLGARVMQTLGQYPDAALEWLTSTDADTAYDYTDPSGLTLGDARVQWWFGDRDSSAYTTGDGFEGVSALWAGAQAADGGFLSDPRDTATMTKIAELSSAIFENLSENESMTATNMSLRGSEALAAAIILQLDQLAESPIVANQPDVQFTQDGRIYTIDANVLGNGDVPIPNVSDTWLRDLLTLAAGSESAQGALEDAMLQYQRDAIEAAGTPGSTLTAEAALARIVSIQGLMDGSVFGSEIIFAKTEDEGIRNAMDLVSNFIPGIPGNYLVGVAGDIVIDQGIGLIVDGWADNYADVMANHEAGSPERDERLREIWGGLVDDLRSEGIAMEWHGAEVSDDELMNFLADMYEDESKGPQAEAQG